MKLPSINSKQVGATVANRLDIRHGQLDAPKIMLLASWTEEGQDEKGYWRTGKPTATWWRAWKIRKRSLFAAGLRPKTTPAGMVVEWRAKEPLPPLLAIVPPRAVKRPPRGSEQGKKGIPRVSKAGLLPHQPPAVARHIAALRAHGGTLEASTTGVGKTFIALATARELGLEPAIVCPKNIISGWQEAADLLRVKPLFINNYEQLKCGNQAGVDIDPFRWRLGRKQKRVMVIFDEAHRLKNQMTANGALAISAAAFGLPTMQLSATIAQSPTEMFVTGLLLGLHKGGQSFIQWAQEYGCVFDGMGLTFTGGEESMRLLHQDLFPEHGYRIRSADIPGFPESQVIAKSLDTENADEIAAVYEEMALEMERHEMKREADGLKLLNMLCQMTRARQHAELLKVPMIVELIKDLLANGHSVPVFVNYRETLTAIGDRLLDLVTCAQVVGGQTKKIRDSNVARFQSGEARVVLCQMQAGGESISLHDLDGRFPRASIISPGFDARAVIQACGRTPRANGKSLCLQYIVFAHNTIEDAAYRCVARKSGNIESLNDGDLAAGLIPTFKK